MNDILEVIQKAKSSMAVAVTGGLKVEARKALVRKATTVEESGYNKKGLLIIDRCPGCGDPIPAVKVSIEEPSYIIAEHTIMIADYEEAICGYGGEPLNFLTALPQ